MKSVLRSSLALALLLGVLATTAFAERSLGSACIRASDRSTPVSFRSPDGVRLAGNVLGRGKTGIVFAHQVAGDRCQWIEFARELSSKGYRALVFDMRGYGTSAGVANVSPQLDVLGATAELRRRGAKKIVLVGASMGGTGVVSAAPITQPAVAGVVELSAPTAFGGANALAAAKKLKLPALFVAGRDDGDFAAATRALYRAAATRDKTLRIAPTPWHGVDLMALPTVRKLVLDFVERVA